MQVQADATISTAAAVAALTRWGNAVDPRNPAHVQAYKMARLSSERPRLGRVLALIERQRLSLDSSCSLGAEYFVVPKANFANADEMPEVIARNIVTPNTLATFELPVGGTLDVGLNYVVDMCCPREILGRGVKTIKCAEKAKRSVEDRGDGASGEGGSSLPGVGPAAAGTAPGGLRQ